MRYEAPKTTKEAVALLAKAKGLAHVLAGGTDLLVRLRSGQVEPDLVVDIKRIPAMGKISAVANGIRIAARCRAPCWASMPASARPGRAWSRPRS